MAKKNIADKYWIYGEDAELAARLTSYLTRVVYNQRANYIRALMKIKEGKYNAQQSWLSEENRKRSAMVCQKVRVRNHKRGLRKSY
ncbi:MAG: hypothetical protein UC991_07435 [Gemmiger sp.]|uniref:hypothetical protein n=1 Tax=Gemmiger sp. TaxID=2049027 RepID=UPI002E7A3C0E|nr:hypothetical protein [Gemmiger sp.]MEE0498293.1 hypothetical protein [Gemmiger sp.]